MSFLEPAAPDTQPPPLLSRISRYWRGLGVLGSAVGLAFAAWSLLPVWSFEAPSDVTSLSQIFVKAPLITNGGRLPVWNVKFYCEDRGIAYRTDRQAQHEIALHIEEFRQAGETSVLWPGESFRPICPIEGDYPHFDLTGPSALMPLYDDSTLGRPIRAWVAWEVKYTLTPIELFRLGAGRILEYDPEGMGSLNPRVLPFQDGLLPNRTRKFRGRPRNRP